MKISPYSVVLAALALVVSHASDVVTATTSNFDTVLASSSLVLVEFYAPWCGHCKTLAPIWEQAATELKGSVVLAKVDATVESALAEKFEIAGFPTIKYFRDGALEGTYESGRSLAEIVAFAKSYSGPAVNRVETKAEVDVIKMERELVVVAYGVDAALEATFAAAANKLRAAAVFVIAPSAAKPADAVSSVLLYKSFEESAAAATDANLASVDALVAFVKAESLKIFDEMGPQNFRQYIERGLPIAWLFVRPSDGGDERKRFAEIAQQYKGRVSFIWVDAEKYGSISERLGLSGKSFPAFALDDTQGSHFALPDASDLSTEAVIKFVDGVLDGSITKTVRSEPAPEPDTENGLTTIVGSTFDALVTNSDVDVLIEFYAPWCGHCKTLAPTYAAVAKSMAGPSLRVAKLDATANDFDVKRFTVKGFPTIFYVPVGGEPELYNGDRDEASITGFIKVKQNGRSGGADVRDDL